MAFVSIPGGAWLNAPPFGIRPDAFSANLVIDATGEKAAAIGSVWTPNRGSKNITRVQFPFGAVTKAGGSALTLSLQDVDTANAFRPDGGADQTVAIANADGAFLSSTWYRSGALSATRTVAHGDPLAVVLEYDGAGRLGADSVVWSSILKLGEVMNRTGNALFTASWSAINHPVIVLEFDDGTFGTLDNASIAKTLSTLAYKSDSSPDEHALVINPVAPCKVDGFWACLLLASTAADFDVVLYDGTTPLVTKSFDAHTLNAPTARFDLIESFAEQTLAVGSTYYLSVKPSQATATATLHYFDVNHADHRQAMPGGTQLSYANRVDAGAWANQSTTRIPYMGLHLSAIHDGSGAGMLVHPGMSGGCNG